MSPNTFTIVNNPLAQPKLVIQKILLTPPTYFIVGRQFVNFTSTLSCPGEEDVINEFNGYLVDYASGNGPFMGQSRLFGTYEDAQFTNTWDFSRP